MQRYIDQLIEDISKVQKSSPNTVLDNKSSFEKHIEEVERYIHEDPIETLGQHTGLSLIEFPDEKLLTDEQCEHQLVYLIK